jgi:PAS domain S-box-containing protein
VETILIRVLIVEDDKVDQIAYERFIRENNLPYDYTIAGSVAEGKQMLEDQKFDIVVTDYFLGDGTAFDIFDDASDIPIILATGGGDEEIAVKAMKTGAYDYFIKDSERHYLKILPVTIENAIKQKKAEEQFRVLSHAIMSINDSVYITDMDDKIKFVNDSFCRTYGYEEKEILGKSSKELWKNESSDKMTPTTLPEPNCKTWHEECIHKRKDGSEFPVSLSRSVIKDEKQNAVSMVGIVRDISQRKRAEEEREKLIKKLQAALADVKTLSGFIPICASCKKIRDDQGYWNQIEAYIQEHSGAEFSHSICPDCMKKLYSNSYKKKIFQDL